MSITYSISDAEKIRNPRFLHSYYLAARATADWLCGETPKAIRYRKKGDSGSFLVEFGTDLTFFDPLYDECGGVTDEDLAKVLNQAFIWVSGSAALYACPYHWAELPYAYDTAWNDLKFARGALEAVSSSEREIKSVVFAVWDGALTIFAHPRVQACVEELAFEIMFRERVSDVSGELTDHFGSRLGDLRMESYDMSVISWPVRGISEFSSLNWGSTMIASSAKGRAHYARLR